MSTPTLSLEEKSAWLGALDFVPPAAYVEFLFNNTFTDSTGNYYYAGDAGWLAGATSVLGYNLDYMAAEFYPGYFLIGTDQGCEVFAIEKATGYFIRTMFVGHDEESVIVVGETWSAFFQRLCAGNIYD